MPAGASAADSARNAASPRTWPSTPTLLPAGNRAASQSTWPGVLAWAIFMSVTPVPANWFSACTQ
ncbi:Uncharacterised protein [Bordetella pertussis]|nr:Uncharacterised protein [Bordetella pertussis]CFN45011.1 Uncharacterised protein [Bordetella pertussis]CFO26112.1 Uncharacterised protein [Bordetella pertussis]CFO36288.1 Uncharacterised protein [Bordetella pertussis]CFO64574.1 Uncharacterised protein [Bordetella pertussis]